MRESSEKLLEQRAAEPWSLCPQPSQNPVGRGQSETHRPSAGGSRLCWSGSRGSCEMLRYLKEQSRNGRCHVSTSSTGAASSESSEGQTNCNTVVWLTLGITIPVLKEALRWPVTSQKYLRSKCYDERPQCAGLSQGCLTELSGVMDMFHTFSVQHSSH